MPDRGLLTNPAVPVPAIRTEGMPWRLEDCRVAQLTYEVDQQAALSYMPGDVNRPVPCYARLFVLEAGSSPIGAFRMASLMLGGRYRMMPKNLVVELVVDGPADVVGSALGAGVVAGKVELDRGSEGVEARIDVEGEQVAAVTLPGPRAIDPTMLRWDAWLNFAAQGEGVQIVEFGPRPEPVAAFLSKGATLETPTGLDRGNVWRRLRNLNTVSACYVEGALELTAPEVQQALL